MVDWTSWQLLLNSRVQTCGEERRQYVRAIEFARKEDHHTVVELLKSHRPWTEADQEALEDKTLLFSDQTPEGIAKQIAELDRMSAEDEDEDYQDGDMALEASEETKGLEFIKEDSGIHEDGLAETYILSLPSATMKEAGETLIDSGDAHGLPGDAIWAEAYENFSSEYPWLLK
ncbi:hypothetical protein LY76DRAFT_659254 [Colletotrichum caudatum]|nr:hypothetical protein LY76DRAFT_659254 [Colletotrichum caudatum]